MSNIFNNLSKLVSDMRSKNWQIDLFDFQFKGSLYFVFVELYLDEEYKPEYGLAKLIFVDRSNLERKLLLHSNSTGFLELDVKEFRIFFNIPYIQGGIGDAIQNFKEKFSETIPTFVREKSECGKEILSDYIDSKRTRNLGRYLSHVKRLNGQKRSILTDNKAKLLRPDVYEHFKDDATITFCFYQDRKYEKSAENILTLFSNTN